MRRWGYGVILVAACAAGCKGSSETAVNPGGDAGTMVNDQSPVTIEFLEHGNPDYGRANAAVFAAYTKAHPNVTIKVTTLEYPSLTATLLAQLKTDRLPA